MNAFDRGRPDTMDLICPTLDGGSSLRVLVIIPAYNEEESLLAVVQSVIESGYDYVVVNDGSRDGTLKLCRDYGLNVIDLPRNLGIGGAVQTGHLYAREHGYDIDIQFDGDGQHDASYIEALIDKIADGADLAIGSRYLEKSDGFQSTVMRRIGSRWLSFWTKLLCRRTVTDPTSGFRASGRRAICLFCDNYPVDYPEPESIVTALKCGLEVRDVPVVMHERQGGTSSISPLSSIYFMIKVTLAMGISALSSGSRHRR